MISSFNHRLLLIEQALSNNGAVLAQLQLLDDLDSKSCADTSSYSDCEENELDRLSDWVVRLRAQVARTERRLERLRANIERHDAQLCDIKSRIIWSSAGCAVVRPHGKWDAQRGTATNREPVNRKWPLSFRIPHQKLWITHTRASGGSWSARDVIEPSDVTPHLSQSFTSLSSAK